MKLLEQEAIIEAVLFVAGEAISLSVLAETIECDKATTKTLVESLVDRYLLEKRGIHILQIGDCYQMCTNPNYYEQVKKVYKANLKRPLSQSSLETLAIIAYKQPITKNQIEEIRGVNADYSVNRLVELGLVVEKGRLMVPGKPIAFGTSDEFLKHYGMSNLAQLPQLDNDIEKLKQEAELEITL